MNILPPSLVPMHVADLRASADAAATARAAPARPPVVPIITVPPSSTSQGALVARGFLDPREVSPLGAADMAGDAAGQTPDRPPTRVLKPWGVPMLPSEERRTSTEAMAPEKEPARGDVGSAAGGAPRTGAPDTAPQAEVSPRDGGGTGRQPAAETEAVRTPAPTEPDHLRTVPPSQRVTLAL